MRIFAVQRILGVVVALSGAIMLAPLAIALALDEDIAYVFGDSFLLIVVAGVAMWLPVRGARQELRLRDGFLVTTLAWVLVCLACSVPFVLGPTQMSFTDAVFESTSGLTTTGATAIVGLDALPKSILFYRQMLQFFGGMGIIILAVAILPMLKIGGSQLFRAETTGPVKDSKLTPRIAETARALWLIYVGLNLLCALAFWVAGMDGLDAVGHAFATVATAGFSTHDASLGYFDSALIEGIAIVFMFVGAINYSLHFAAWRRASLTAFFADSELRAMFVILLVTASAVVAALAVSGFFPSFGLALRHGIFQTVSNLTTTGFTTTGFHTWPGFVALLLLMLGFVGGCAGSTTGGMKVVRILMLFRQGAREVKQLVHPKGRFMVKMGSISVPGAVLAAVTGFCTLYLMSTLLMTLALAATGLDLITAFSAVATCINNMGPALGIAAVHFADINDVAVWICSFAMILGRLEVFTVVVLLTPAFWRE